MKYQCIYPDYYPFFSCIAGACKHNCCIGWEIDVDPYTREYYSTVSGEIGKRLAENIVDDGEISFFRMGESGRCPFLNENNLCDLILTLGEDSLCQICDDHPRFMNDFSSRSESGVGLCCEAAGQLILSREEPMKLVCASEMESIDDKTVPQEETELLALREALIETAQNRSLSIETRIDQILNRSGLSPNCSSARWAEILLRLERLDEAWTAQLNLLKSASDRELSAEWDTPFEQLLVYLLYRHLPGALDDGNLSGRIAYCGLMCRLIRHLFSIQPEQSMDVLVELARLYSSEIEYSDENLNAILAEL